MHKQWFDLEPVLVPMCIPDDILDKYIKVIDYYIKNNTISTYYINDFLDSVNHEQLLMFLLLIGNVIDYKPVYNKIIELADMEDILKKMSNEEKYNFVKNFLSNVNNNDNEIFYAIMTLFNDTNNTPAIQRIKNFLQNDDNYNNLVYKYKDTNYLIARFPLCVSYIPNTELSQYLIDKFIIFIFDNMIKNINKKDANTINISEKEYLAITRILVSTVSKIVQ